MWWPHPPGKDIRRGVIYPNEDLFGRTGMQPVDTQVLPFNGAGAFHLHVWDGAARALMWEPRC